MAKKSALLYILSEHGKKPGKVPYEEREDYEPCAPRYIRKHLKHLPSEDKELIETYIDDMLTSCTIGAVRQRDIPKLEVPPERKVMAEAKRMNGWICYCKSCVKETGMNYKACVTDKERKDKLYYPRKEYWKDLAYKGCPL